MTQVIHTGDTHLGYRQYHSAERQSDFLDGFRTVTTDAIESDVDAVVHAGDLFHDRRPRLQDIMGAMSILRDLADAEIPFLAVVGNHEGKRDAQWLDLFESLDLATRLDATPTVIGDTAFYGLDFVARAQRDAYQYDFEPHDADHAALVSHGLFEPFDHGDWDAREILSESDVAFDVMLLGDDHTPAKREVEGTWLTYCGSTERASADEREARGYNIVTFDDEVDIRRRSIETREFVFVDVELAEGEGGKRVRERVGQHDLTDAVVIVTIEGEGEPVPPAGIEEFARDRGALIARVNDRREIDEESAYQVSFADPDDAVHERIQQLGLSPAAQELDEVVRASKVADSNVDDSVQGRVRELVTDADADTFEPAPPEANSDKQQTEESQDDTDENDVDPTGVADESPVDSAGPAEEDSETQRHDDDSKTQRHDDDSKTQPHDDDSETQPNDDDAKDAGVSDDSSGTDEAAPGDQSHPDGDGEDQATMEEYL
ncbi:DNA double-strand break repair protein Mre11 [Halorhabdus salina]|uniref:DNA double-strand break repair protein Mre11 n=1 Tax=Halorhabdus salina TaxID=2750670 RepID=UPI0015EE9760|nr:DNA double-strand break repair protein Mre11 [Halorhabdus salina]